MTAHDRKAHHLVLAAPSSRAEAGGRLLEVEGLHHVMRLLFHYLEREPGPGLHDQLIEAVGAVKKQIEDLSRPCPVGTWQLPSDRLLARRYSGPTGWTGPPAAFYRLRFGFGFQPHQVISRPSELRLGGVLRGEGGGALPEVAAVSAGAPGEATEVGRHRFSYTCPDVSAWSGAARKIDLELALPEGRGPDRTAPPRSPLLLLLEAELQIDGDPGRRWSEASVLKLELDDCRRAPSCAVVCLNGCAAQVATPI